jgi:hypothetical protein
MLRLAGRAGPQLEDAHIHGQCSLLLGDRSYLPAIIRVGFAGRLKPEDAEMTSKWIAFLFTAMALGGCCASGTGCYAPEAGTPVAWDGLGPLPDTGSPPDDGPQVIVADRAAVTGEQPRRPAKKIVKPAGEGSAASGAKPHSDQWWAQKEAEDRAAEKTLAQKLIICRGCSSSSPRTEDAATASVPH